jgi:EAL domain-containing protein (putative c-di-GMP-specific phosphodiesterase class I)
MTDQALSEEKSPMKEQRDRFLAFAFASSDLFFEISEEGRITHAYGAARGITGTDEKSLVGRKWLELFSVYEQASMIHTIERAKPGMRIGPILVNLSETLGGRKAILTGIKMPGSNKFYVTLGVTNAIMARIAHAISQHEGFDILTKEIYIEAVQNALTRCRTTGQEISITFFDFAPTRLERNRMGEGPWAKLRDALGEFLISESFDGYTAGEISDGRYSFIHDKKLSTDALRDKVTAITKQNDPSGQGLVIKAKTLTIDLKSLNERESEPSITYTVNEFGQKGIDMPFQTLNAAFSSYISTSTPKVKEFQSLIERSGFALYFQPVVDLKANQAAHFEMFCHFESGSTKEWVRFGEDVGLASVLDKAMYERAISHVKFKAGGTWTKFSVNLSVRSLEDPAFIQAFVERMETHKNLAERLIFEITESTTVQQHQKLAKFIAEMQGLGFRIALDHFIPEPAFINLLKQFNPDIVKIDGRYVRRISSSQRDAGLVRSTAETCRGMNIEVIAKWVEDKSQADMLQDMGIGFAQGFYFGKPGPKPDYIPPKE